jgi:4-hydroxy-tetrahydrodipicolinate synthase
VVVLPPYYFRKATDEGLFKWFSELITKAVPENKYLLGYHIPGMTGVGFSLDLLARLKNTFPIQFAGIKDSSHNEAFAVELGQRFGQNLLVLNGTDSLLHHALKNHAQGAITAPANIISDGLREVWDLYQAGKDSTEAQARVTEQRHILEKYMPFPVVLKTLMPRLFELPRWSVKPPLEDMDEAMVEEAMKEFSEVS